MQKMYSNYLIQINKNHNYYGFIKLELELETINVVT